MIKRPTLLALVVVLVAALSSQASMLGSVSSITHPSAKNASVLILLRDGFASLRLGMNWRDGSRHGNWRDRWNGMGRVGIVLDGTKVRAEQPKTARWSGETHSALVTSLKTFGDMEVTLKVKTVKQLRTPRPNSWEMGWVLWHYRDNLHFYYLMLKTNGWELGKEDPAYRGNMRTMVRRYSPKFHTRTWYAITVLMVGRRIAIWVNGRLLGTFRDWQRPYYSGRLGLYCEDSRAEFDNVLVTKA